MVKKRFLLPWGSFGRLQHLSTFELVKTFCLKFISKNLISYLGDGCILHFVTISKRCNVALIFENHLKRIVGYFDYSKPTIARLETSNKLHLNCIYRLQKLINFCIK